MTPAEQVPSAEELDALESHDWFVTRDDLRTIRALRARVRDWENASQNGHGSPCTLGPLCPYCEIDRLRAALARAEQERDALRADAERYRWLRRFDHFAQVDAMLDTTEYNTLDAAIDAARQAAWEKN